VIWRTAAAV